MISENLKRQQNSLEILELYAPLKNDWQIYNSKIICILLAVKQKQNIFMTN